MSRVIKLFKIPEETTIPGLREMKPKDISDVTKLLNNYLENFLLYNKFTEAEVKHFFLPKKDVIYTYVVEKDNKVTDFLSFYYLPSTVINNPKHDKLKAAYSYYNVVTSVPLTELIRNALIIAKKNDFDVFNALDIMENSSFFKELLFSPGDGNLHYYLYNWRLTRLLEPKELGMVLV